MKSLSEELIIVSGSLETLRERLKIGQKVQARILKNISNNCYIIRVWGYNFCLESEYSFKEQQEVIFEVKQLYPIIVFNYVPPRYEHFDPVNLSCNIIA